MNLAGPNNDDLITNRIHVAEYMEGENNNSARAKIEVERYIESYPKMLKTFKHN